MSLQSPKSPYPTTSGSSLEARQTPRGSQRPLYLSNSSATSKVQGSSPRQVFSAPEPPCQILVISPKDSTLAVPGSSAEPTSPTPSTSSHHRRLLSRRPRQLPPIPESELPSFGRTGTRWHHSSPRARANPSTHPESYGYMCREAPAGRSLDSLILTRDRRGEYTSPPAPPKHRLLAEKDRFEYDTPPPSYRTFDCLDDNVVCTSKGFEDKPKHLYVLMPNC
jgi:hypothetical protein